MQAPRLYYSLLAFSSGGLLAFGVFYLEYTLGLEACPLCLFQRIAYLAITVISCMACIHAPQSIGLRIYSGLIFISALIGTGIAGRQVYLQHLPADKIPECGPGLDYMLEVFPLGETLRMVLSGSGECAEVSWRFLSLSIAEWSMFCFMVFALLSAIHVIRKRINTWL